MTENPGGLFSGQQVDSMTDHYDVVIVGGGMVGATLASAMGTACGGRALRVLVIEQQSPTMHVPSSAFDTRSIVLSRSTARFLYQHGFWPAIEPCVTPIKYINVEAKGQFGELVFSAQEANVPALGYVVGGSDLGRVLWESVRQSKWVTWSGGSTVTHLAPEQCGWRVGVSASSEQAISVFGRLLVVADGARSETLQLLGVSTDYHDYRQKALVALFQGSSLDFAKSTALERFMPGGESIALLPRGSARVGLVHALSAATADAVVAMPAGQQRHFFADALGVDAASFGQCLSVHAYPLVSSMAKELVRPNAVVLGNAAQTMHPIAGQGFNLAVRDVSQLVQLIAARQSRHDCLNDALLPGALLQRYAQERSVDRWRISQFCHGLLTLFATERRGLALLRQLGLCAFDTLPEAKAWLAHRVLAPRTGAVALLD